jgi:ribosomal protein S12 methylthiotransferase
VNIRAEVEELSAAGVAEIVLVAQDLAAYGRDIDAPGGIVDLLRFVSDMEGLRSLRLLYLYPREITDALIGEVTENPSIAPYFDLSLQHASGRLLRAMRRPGDGERHLDLIDRIRAAAPEAALRSSFIIGFPGETEDDLEVLAGFLEAASLDWAGFFPYSPEEGTPAAGLPEQVDPEEAAERTRRMQELQDSITATRSADQVGRVLEVLVDQVEDGVPVARSYREAPEIDGVILLDRGVPGQWLLAEVTAAYGTELEAVVV